MTTLNQVQKRLNRHKKKGRNLTPDFKKVEPTKARAKQQIEDFKRMYLGIKPPWWKRLFKKKSQWEKTVEKVIKRRRNEQL